MLAELRKPGGDKLKTSVAKLEDFDQRSPPLRRGEADVALAFHHDASSTDAHEGHTVIPLLREPMHLLSRADDGAADPPIDLAACRDRRWITGCERCHAHLLSACARHDFTPRIGFETDDYVAAGLGVTTLPGLALRAHLNPGVRVVPIAGDHRFVSAVTFGAPPLPAPVRAFLAA